MTAPSVALAQRPRPVAFVVSLVIAWLLLGFVALWLRRGPIEDDLADRATAAIRATGAAHAEVSTDGRAVVVHGRFDNAEAAEQALSAAAVSGTSSARLADDVVIATLPAAPLVIETAGGGLAVTATVPDSATRAELLGAVADATGGEISATVTVDDDVAMPAVGTIAELVDALDAAPGIRSVTIDGSSVVLSGTAPDQAARASLGGAALAAVQDSVPGATVDNRLAVASGPAGAHESTGTRPGPADDAISTSVFTSTSADAGDRAALAAALAGRSLTFDSNSATLSDSLRSDLDQIARALRTGGLTVIVGGHADVTGPLVLNQALSLDRARAAADYLTGQGVPADQVRPAGFGPDRPVADNATSAGRAANRRIDIIPVADQPVTNPD